MNSIGPPFRLCWICGKVLDLGNCQVNEHGNAVHENCYVVAMLNSKPQPKKKSQQSFC